MNSTTTTRAPPARNRHDAGGTEELDAFGAGVRCGRLSGAGVLNPRGHVHRSCNPETNVWGTLSLRPAGRNKCCQGTLNSIFKQAEVK